MNRIKSALVGLLSLLTVSPALGQSAAPPKLPAQSVWGRLGIPGDTGPGQAIPMARLNIFLLNSLCQTNNAMPVYSTASGQWVCTPNQTANTVLAGPTSGGAAQGAYRALVGPDLPIPGSSSLGGVRSFTCSASNWVNTLSSSSGIFACSQPAFTDIAGSVAATQLPNPSATTLGGVQSKAAVSHQFLNTISTSGVPGAAQPACADISDAASGCNAARGQLPGETGTGSASAGNVGEYIPSTIVIGSAVSLTTTTPANVTSISISAGDWDVSAMAYVGGGSTTTFSFCEASVSTTTATQDRTDTRDAGIFYNNAAVLGSLSQITLPIGPSRFSVSGSTTVFLVARCNFGTSTANAFGTIRARRAR